MFIFANQLFSFQSFQSSQWIQHYYFQSKKKKNLLSIEKTKENYLNKEYKQKFIKKLSWKEMWY